jgi:hypothetical protein
MGAGKPRWDIRNAGRPWGKEEAWEGFILKPEKIEMRIARPCWPSSLRTSARIGPYCWATRWSGAQQLQSCRISSGRLASAARAARIDHCT